MYTGQVNISPDLGRRFCQREAYKMGDQEILPRLFFNLGKIRIPSRKDIVGRAMLPLNLHVEPPSFRIYTVALPPELNRILPSGIEYSGWKGKV
jgi:hypothetical protein